MTFAEMTATLALDEGRKAKLWDRHVIRAGLAELGLYFTTEAWEGQTAAELRAGVVAALDLLAPPDLFALLAVAEQLGA